MTELDIQTNVTIKFSLLMCLIVSTIHTVSTGFFQAGSVTYLGHKNPVFAMFT